MTFHSAVRNFAKIFLRMLERINRINSELEASTSNNFLSAAQPNLMENSFQMETFPMKTHLNINLETEIRLRISTDINLRRVNKIKFLIGSILVAVFFRVSDLKTVFIYPSECEFRTGFPSRRDSRLTFPSIQTGKSE